MLIIEDGSGVENADTFVSVVDADQYAIDRGLSSWAGETDTTAKEAALRRAADYLRDNYAQRWRGEPNEDGQALPFPRNGETTIPAPVIRANIELAIIALDAPLWEVEEARGGILAESRGVGPLQRSFQFANTGQRQRVFRNVDKMLSAFLDYPGLKVVRI